MITDVEDYFTKGCGRCKRFATADCSTRQWEAGLARLRQICREAGLAETLKWGHPCYTHAGRNIAILGAFRGDFRLTFIDAALLKDAKGVLEKIGPESQHANVIRFTDNARVAKMAPVVRAYLKEAMGYAEAGIKPAKQVRAVDLPEELVAALDGDPELAAAFRALTPGRQRSYAVNLAAAKSAATRLARIAKFRPKILAGKGALER